MHRQSLARFTTRDLLWLMVGVSVLSAIVAAILPHVSPARQPRFLAAVAVAVGVAALAAMIVLISRAQVERYAGTTLVVVHTDFRPNDWFWLSAQLAIGTSTLALSIAIITLDGLSGVLHCLVIYGMGFMAVERAFVAGWGRARVLELRKWPDLSR